jgi:hypothetical protein
VNLPAASAVEDGARNIALTGYIRQVEHSSTPNLGVTLQ